MTLIWNELRSSGRREIKKPVYYIFLFGVEFYSRSILFNSDYWKKVKEHHCISLDLFVSELVLNYDLNHIKLHEAYISTSSSINKNNAIYTRQPQLFYSDFILLKSSLSVLVIFSVWIHLLNVSSNMAIFSCRHSVARALPRLSTSCPGPKYFSMHWEIEFEKQKPVINRRFRMD